MKESENYSGTVVVIPTRNRAELAMNAIRSVLSQPVADVWVLISDNSTRERDRSELANFCEGLADPRVCYLNTPQAFSMTANWEWAITQALARYDASHFIYLTDRFMFKQGRLKEVLGFAARYPDKIISYNHDRIDDHARPIRVEQHPGTGELLEVETQRLAQLYSQGRFHPALPRMLNCLVPCSVVELVRRRFGNVFASICPDYSFCCRCLEMEDTILFYDKSPSFHYALDRSNGASVTRGEITSDSADFAANLPVPDSMRNSATPLPGVITTGNAILNEYFIIQRETKSPRFPKVDQEKYLHYLARELEEIEDARLRSEMLQQLIANGYVANGDDESGRWPAGDEPAAFYGLIPEFYLINGEKVKVYQSMDTMTHPRYQKRGLFTHLANMTHDHVVEKEDGINLVGIPGSNSLPGFVNKLNWKHIHDFSYFFVSRTWFAARNVFARKAQPRWEPAAEMGTELAQYFERREVSDKPISNLVSADFFDWRVFQNPYKQFHVLEAKDGNSIDGVCVYTLDEKRRCFVHWLDFATPEAFVSNTASLIAHLFSENGSDFVYTWKPLNENIRHAFASCGFMTNPLKRGPFTYRVPLIVRAQGKAVNTVDWFAIDNFDLQPLMQD